MAVRKSGLLIEMSGPCSSIARNNISALESANVTDVVVSGAWTRFDFGKTLGVGVNGSIFSGSVFANKVVAWAVRKWLFFIYSLNRFTLTLQETPRNHPTLILCYWLGTYPGPGRNFSSGLIYENFSDAYREHPKLRPLVLPIGERRLYLLEGGLWTVECVKSDFLPYPK